MPENSVSSTLNIFEFHMSIHLAAGRTDTDHSIFQPQLQIITADFRAGDSHIMLAVSSMYIVSHTLNRLRSKRKSHSLSQVALAPPVGLEPTTCGLTVRRSTD